MRREHEQQFEELVRLYGEGESHSVFTGKSGRRYEMFVSSRGSSFYIWTVCLDENAANIDSGLAEFIRNWRGSQHHPSNFFEVPDELLEKPAFLSSFVVQKDFQRDGLATKMMEAAIERLKEYDATHYDGFTSLGKIALFPKYLQAGYQHCAVKEGAELPAWMRKHTDWVYKHHHE